MFPNKDETMYYYTRMGIEEIRNEAKPAGSERVRPHILRRRLKLLTSVALIGLTLAVTTLALGWWVL